MIWVNNYKIKLKYFQTLESICSYWSWDYTHSCMSFNYKLFIRVTVHPSFFVLRPSLFILYFLSTDKGASQECMAHDGKRYEIYLHAIENMKIAVSKIIYLLITISIPICWPSFSQDKKCIWWYEFNIILGIQSFSLSRLRWNTVII